MSLDRGRRAADVLLRERASATPLVRHVRSGIVDSGVTPVDRRLGAQTLVPSSLVGLQEWFARGVMTPESQAEALGASQTEVVLTAGPQLGARDRFEIYRRAYHARLIECLLDDYPVLAHALGNARFDALCRAYIERHPSTEANLNGFGKNMPLFCASEAPEPFEARVFASDLAALEWAIVEVIHAAGGEPLTMDRLGTVAPESWPGARLVPTPAFRLLKLDFPVNAYFQAVREDEDPAIPSAAASGVVVYRTGSTIWRMDLEDAAFRLLHALAAGQSLAAALDEAATGLSNMGEDAAGRRVTAWFRDWVQSGLFSGVETA